MTNALMTMALSPEYKELGKRTFPLMQEYASKYNLDFVACMVDRRPGRTFGWNRMDCLRSLLEIYERIIQIEVDVIVNPAARDVLSLLPEGVFYGFDAIDYDPLRCEPCWLHAYDDWPNEFKPGDGYPGFMYNAGAMIVDKSHRALFAPTENELDHGMVEQAVVNMRLHKLGMRHKNVPDVIRLSYTWTDQPKPDFLAISWQQGSKADGVAVFWDRMMT